AASVDPAKAITNSHAAKSAQAQSAPESAMSSTTLSVAAIGTTIHQQSGRNAAAVNAQQKTACANRTPLHAPTDSAAPIASSESTLKSATNRPIRSHSHGQPSTGFPTTSWMLSGSTAI